MAWSSMELFKQTKMRNMTSSSPSQAAQLLRCWVCFILFFVIGCSNQQPDMQKVSGTVMFSDGKPVTGENSSVVFIPDANSTGPPRKSASGIIKPDGSFLLMTNNPGDGAYHGSYKVILKVWDNYREQRSAVPGKYTEVTTSPLRADVGPGTERFEFTIDR